MSKFLLPCPACKADQTVGIAQAGAVITCSQCGTTLDVPGTRQLRTLPSARDATDALRSSDRAAGSGKSVLTRGSADYLYRGVTAAMLVIAAIGFGYGGYLTYLRMTAPIEFGHTEEELYQEFKERSLSDPLATSWDHWNYLVEQGVPDPDPPIYFQLDRMYQRQWPWLVGSLAVGAVALVSFLGMTLAAARRSKTP